MLLFYGFARELRASKRRNIKGLDGHCDVAINNAGAAVLRTRSGNGVIVTRHRATRSELA
jgi:hypothetical protein